MAWNAIIATIACACVTMAPSARLCYLPFLPLRIY